VHNTKGIYCHCKVVLSLPFGVFGAYISTKFWLEKQYLFQIALIMAY